MSELAPEFKQKIAAFDGNSAISEKEKDVMFYVESWARDMPPAYLNKLISAIEVKLKNKELSKDQIRQECEEAIRELNKEIQGKEYNIGIVLGKDGKYNDNPKKEATKNFEEFVSSGTSLKNCSSKAIGRIFSYIFAHSSKEMGDEFSGEKNNGALQKFTNKMKNDPEGLIHISKNWGNGAIDGIDRHLQFEPAKKVEIFIIKDSMGEAIEGAIDSRLHGFLRHHNIDKKDGEIIANGIKKSIDTHKHKNTDKFFNEILTDFQKLLKGKGNPLIMDSDKTNLLRELLNLDSAGDKIQSQRIKIENPELSKYISQIDAAKNKEEQNKILADAQKNISDPSKINELKKYIEKKNAIELQKIRINTLTDLGEGGPSTLIINATQNNKTDTAISASVAPSQELTRTDNKIRNLLNKKDSTTLTDADRKRAETLLEGKTDKESIALLASIKKTPELRTQEKREFIKAVRNIDVSNTELDKILQKEGKNIDNAFLESSASYKKQGDMNDTTGKIPNFATLKNGQTEQITLGAMGSGNSSGSLGVSVTKEGEQISVKIGTQDAISLSETQYPAYMKSMEFLQETGLGYLAKNLSPQDIQKIFKATSDLGNTNVDNQDSTFGNEEQRLFLKNIARVLQIDEGMNQVNELDMQDYIRSKLQEKSFENRVFSLEKNWFKNQSINTMGLSDELSRSQAT